MSGQLCALGHFAPGARALAASLEYCREENNLFLLPRMKPRFLGHTAHRLNWEGFGRKMHGLNLGTTLAFVGMVGNDEEVRVAGDS